MLLTNRREILRILAMLPIGMVLPKSIFAANSDAAKTYTETIGVLKSAYTDEMTSHKQYAAFIAGAMAEGYANIAYLFKVFSVSNKMHAKNYQKVLNLVILVLQ